MDAEIPEGQQAKDHKDLTDDAGAPGRQTIDENPVDDAQDGAG